MQERRTPTTEKVLALLADYLKVKHGTVSVTLGSIAKATTVNVDVTVNGLLTTDKILVQCQNDLEHGLVCIAAYCPTNGTLRLRITNWSAAAVTGAAKTWAYWATPV